MLLRASSSPYTFSIISLKCFPSQGVLTIIIYRFGNSCCCRYENSTSGGGRKRENEKESEHTYSSVGKSADTYFHGFTHIIYVFLYFRKSPLKVSIWPERHFKAISVFYKVLGATVFFKTG